MRRGLVPQGVLMVSFGFFKPSNPPILQSSKPKGRACPSPYPSPTLPARSVKPPINRNQISNQKTAQPHILFDPVMRLC